MNILSTSEGAMAVVAALEVARHEEGREGQGDRGRNLYARTPGNGHPPCYRVTPPLHSSNGVLTGLTIMSRRNIYSTEKKITPNGGLSKDLGDVVKRMATSSGDWETTEP